MTNYKQHQHEWHPRTTYAKPGWYISGYICRCGRKNYTDLIKGIVNEDKEGKRL